MEGGAGQGPLDEPGGPPLPVDDPWNPPGATENYHRERLNQNLRRGGRGCLFPLMVVGTMTVACAVALIGR